MTINATTPPKEHTYIHLYTDRQTTAEVGEGECGGVEVGAVQQNIKLLRTA